MPSRRAQAPSRRSSSAPVQPRGGKKRNLVHDALSIDASTCWGKKRSRSTRNNFRRDWANLGGDGPRGLIAELVLANDVADYIRFRAVCRPWRQCSADPRAAVGLDGRFLPRRWIMLDKTMAASPPCHRFLSISTGECIRTDIPELDEQRLLAVTPEGLLLLLHEPTLIIRLLNPLTRQFTNLPPVTSLLTEDQQAKRSMGGRFSIEVYGVGLVDASMAAVCFSYPRVLAVAKPGDESWTVVYKGFLHSTLPFAGRFYCCVGTRLMVLDATADQQPPRLVKAAERSSRIYFSQMADSLHLVDNAGQLMMVHRSLYQDPEHNYKRKYQLYRVDLDAGALVPVKGFNGQALFMGCRRTISVAAGVFPSITADTLYLGSDLYERKRDARAWATNLRELASAGNRTAPTCMRRASHEPEVPTMGCSASAQAGRTHLQSPPLVTGPQQPVAESSSNSKSSLSSHKF